MDDLPDDTITSQQHTGNHGGTHTPGGSRPGVENIEKGTDVDKVRGLDETQIEPAPGPRERAPERDERGRL